MQKIGEINPLTEHKGHEVVKVQARRRLMYLCKTCNTWIGKRKIRALKDE